jgi:hypothetical protein
VIPLPRIAACLADPPLVSGLLKKKDIKDMFVFLAYVRLTDYFPTCQAEAAAAQSIGQLVTE